jgi:hypothetical protein
MLATRADVPDGPARRAIGSAAISQITVNAKN